MRGTIIIMSTIIITDIIIITVSMITAMHTVRTMTLMGIMIIIPEGTLLHKISKTKGIAIMEAAEMKTLRTGKLLRAA